jgi:hypothetical protein
VYGVGVSAFVAGHYAQRANDLAKAEAIVNSGLFVQVADVTRPVWRFYTRNVALLQQWEEIIVQAFERAVAEKEAKSSGKVAA